MGLWAWFTAEHEDRAHAEGRVARIPRIPAVCCGSQDWVRGSTGVSPAYDGTTMHEGCFTCAIYACMHCGRVIGVNGQGTFEPAPEAMPSAWAVGQLKRQAADQLAASLASGTAPPAPKRRDMMRGVRVPGS